MSPIQPLVASRISSAAKRSMRDHWRLFAAEGAFLSLLGLAAIIVPPLAGIVTAVVLGWLFLIAGIAGLAFTLRSRQAPGHGWSLLSALAALVAGAVLLWNPLQGVLTLTYVLTAFFIIDGILLILLAIDHRRGLTGKWEWMMVNGVMDLVLAGIFILGFPGTFTWALGLLVGLDLLFAGTSLIAMALEARKTWLDRSSEGARTSMP